MRISCIVLFPGSCRAAESTAVGPAAAGWCATGSGCPRPGAGSSCRPGSGSGPSGSSCDWFCHRAQHSSSGEAVLAHLYTHGNFFFCKIHESECQENWLMDFAERTFGVWCCDAVPELSESRHNIQIRLCFTLVIRNSNSCSTRKWNPSHRAWWPSNTIVILQRIVLQSQNLKFRPICRIFRVQLNSHVQASFS